VSIGIPYESTNTPDIIIDLAIPVVNTTSNEILGVILIKYKYTLLFISIYLSVPFSPFSFARCCFLFIIYLVGIGQEIWRPLSLSTKIYTFIYLTGYPSHSSPSPPSPNLLCAGPPPHPRPAQHRLQLHGDHLGALAGRFPRK
jgi:hypothetical protein